MLCYPLQHQRTYSTAQKFELEHRSQASLIGTTDNNMFAMLRTHAQGGTWTPVADMPSRRMDASMTSLRDGRVAIVGGGGSATGPTRSADLFDADANKWTALPDMMLPRDSPGSCVLDSDGAKTLYAFGGTIAYPTPPSTLMNVTGSVEALTLGGHAEAKAWQHAASLPSPRTSPSVASLSSGRACVVAAGFDASQSGFEYLQDAYLFDGSSYTKLPDLPFGRSNMAIVAAAGGVFVIGGGALDPSYYNVSYLQLQPSVATAWKPMAPLQAARSWTMAAALRDPQSGETRLVAAGGMSLQPFFEPMSSVEVYSTKNDSWTLFSDGDAGALPTPVGFGSGAAINATHMLAAGGAGPGTTGTEAFVFSLGTLRMALEELPSVD